MKVSKFLNVKKEEKVANIEITGEIGYNAFADTYDDYKKNTSEAMAAELNALKDLDAEVINITLESLGGDVHHALAIYSLLRNSGAKINTYYRGANASSSTIIGSAADSVDNIYMDSTGLFLVHKVMTTAEGNANDMQNTIDTLNKYQEALETAYMNIGVTKESLSELMERNGGHGEWLTFNEAQSFGFVGSEWNTGKASNYSRATFANKNILIPNQFNNKNNNLMEEKTFALNEEQEPEVVNEDKTLLQKIWNKLSNDSETPSNDVAVENEVTPEEVTDIISEVMQIIEPRLVALEEHMAEMMPSEEEPMEEEVPSEEMVIEAKVEEQVKAALKDIAKPVEFKNTKATAPKKVWEQHLNNFQNIIK